MKDMMSLRRQRMTKIFHFRRVHADILLILSVPQAH